ncbi:class I SAM-dependent DNA methyltransferase [Frondihabitans australicus]|uniref:Methyltransferase family protein n=1 Tax=Frondihabitans australicus TaxID=386892 RepID=A0A495IMT5_9MICO|nr:methyltransferase domain-containing protein [Frondihabitans australicus]RKR76476.1 methyltransferase family protein [Frondihabitans australicus]
MPDAKFDDPRLAVLYDALDGPRDDLDPYLALAQELGAHSIVDIGCGTGEFALLAAGRGFDVTGVDPALASLDVARSKPGADAVAWVHGDAVTAAELGLRADLAAMTGNVAQVFVADDAWHAALAGAAAALRPGGHLVFEARRPEARAWEAWASAPTTTTHEVPGVGRVTHRFEVTMVAPPLVTFVDRYLFDSGESLESTSTLRFRDGSAITGDLVAAGFEVLEVRDAPDRPGLENVFVARRA